MVADSATTEVGGEGGWVTPQIFGIENVLGERERKKRQNANLNNLNEERKNGKKGEASHDWQWVGNLSAKVHLLFYCL